MAEAIKVAVRVRPMNQREQDQNTGNVVSMKDKTTTVQVNGKPKHYTYDYCYMSMDRSSADFKSQEDVFLDIGKAILSNAMDGFNGTLFTYGQTGSGKSYTVMGPPDDAGIIPRTVANLFLWNKNSEAEDKEVQIYISYLEIYKEQVTDLLVTTNEIADLKIMDHPKLGVYVKGLLTLPCPSMEDVMKYLQCGIKKRVTASTNMNARSSRSHSVFTIVLKILHGQRPKSGQKDERKQLSAKVNLIDLAGSERQKKAETTGERLKEGSAINVSLSALGICIKTLCDSNAKIAKAPGTSGEVSDQKGLVVPFRMSKLTFLLKDSLAGNSKTFMMATISPATDNIDETISTLRFASSVKTIQTVAVQNKDKKDAMIEAMEEEIKALKAQSLAGGSNVTVAEVQEMERVKEELQKDYQQKLEDVKEMQIARDKALEENGLSQTHITQAFGISKGTPYLLNMADDPMLAGCLIYLIKEDENTFIGAHQDNTITLKGVGIPDHLCFIENKGNTKAIIERKSQEGRVVVNGKLLRQEGERRELHNGDNIFLGRAYALKLIMPEDPNASPASDLNDLSLEGLEDEIAALDDSASWQNMSMYLDQAQVLRHMPPKAATLLMTDMKKSCRLCDEANELTLECRAFDMASDEQALHFEADLTSSTPPCVVIRVLWTEKGRYCQDEEAWQTKHLWTVDQLGERVDRMNDHCHFFKKNGYMELDDPIEDPWHISGQAEIVSRIRSLEAAAEEARTQVRSQMLQEQMHKLRNMMVVKPREAKTQALFQHFFFRVWKVHVLEEKAIKQQTKKIAGSASPRRSSRSKEGEACPGGCGYQITWHPTHCCGRCSQGSTHGPGCDRKLIIEVESESTAPAPRAGTRRMTIKRPRTPSNERERRSSRSPSPERGLPAKPKAERGKSRVTINSRISGVSPSTARSSLESRTFTDSEAPEATPEVASSATQDEEIDDRLRMESVDESSPREIEAPLSHSLFGESPEATVEHLDREAVRELKDIDILRRQLHDSRDDVERLEDEKYSLRRQLEVAWELCSVLRDYTSNMLDTSVAGTLAASAASSPSKPSGRELQLSPSRPAAEERCSPSSSHSPSPMRMRVAAMPRAQGAFSASAPEIAIPAAAIAQARHSPLARTLPAGPLPPPMAAIPALVAVSTLAPPMEVPSPSAMHPPTSALANIPQASAFSRMAFGGSPASPSSPLSASQRTASAMSPLQAALGGGKIRRFVSSPAQVNTTPLGIAAVSAATGSDSPGRSSPRCASGEPVTASRSTADTAGETSELSPRGPRSIPGMPGLPALWREPGGRTVTASFSSPQSAGSEPHLQRSPQPAMHPAPSGASGTASASGVCLCPSVGGDCNTAFTWPTPVESSEQAPLSRTWNGVGATRVAVGPLQVASSRAASADRHQGPALPVSISMPLASAKPGLAPPQHTTLSAMWGKVGMTRVTASPASRSASAEPRIAVIGRTHNAAPMLPRPEVTASSASTAPAQAPASLQDALQEAREKGRLSVLEEQVRLIAERVGTPLSNKVNEGHGAPEASANGVDYLPSQ